MQYILHRYGFTRIKKTPVLASDDTQSRQNKKYLKNNDLNKASKKMIYNAATKNCRNGGKNHDTQFPADVHSFKLTCFFICTDYGL